MWKGSTKLLIVKTEITISNIKVISGFEFQFLHGDLTYWGVPKTRNDDNCCHNIGKYHLLNYFIYDYMDNLDNDTITKTAMLLLKTSSVWIRLMMNDQFW